jgi:hypothetical protein
MVRKNKLKSSQIKKGNIYRIKDKKRCKTILTGNYLALNDYANNLTYCQFRNEETNIFIEIKITDFTRLKLKLVKKGN